ATVGLWFSLLCKTSLRATVATLLTTVAVGLGHWLPWMCCLAVPGMAGSGLEYVAKVQGGLTPPAALFSLGFWGVELSGYDGRGGVAAAGAAVGGEAGGRDVGEAAAAAAAIVTGWRWDEGVEVGRLAVPRACRYA